MLTQLEGKAFIITLEGKVRRLGFISVANIDQDRTQLEITVELTDEEAAGILGAAADKAWTAQKQALLPYTDEQIERLMDEVKDQL